eukprot:4741452-Amphidinium_carterae.1
MKSGQRRILVMCGLPLGCGHGVDMVHAFLIKSLRCAGRQKLPLVQITTRDLGVDTQWFAWRNPVQQKRISSFRASMYRTHALALQGGFRLQTWPLRFGSRSGLATQTLRQLKLDGQSQTDSVKFALNADLGGVWHEVRANSVSEVGEVCVRCGEVVEDLEHTAWAAERREVALPASALEAPPCVRLHGLLPAPKRQVVLNHKPALASRLGVHVVWTDGSGRHSSNPHFRRRGVGYYTDTGESVFLPLAGLAGLKQSVYRAEFLAVVRALE